MPKPRVRLTAQRTKPANRRDNGFSLIEMMAVVAVMAILATIAVPSVQSRLMRQQIVLAVQLADIAKAPIAAAWSATRTLPADNAAAGLPVPEKVVSNLVSSLRIEAGAIQITFGNQASSALRGQVLSLRPGVVVDAQVVPVAWVCGHAQAPANMTAQGVDRTTVRPAYLPLNCVAP